MRVVPIHPGQHYQDEHGLERTLDATSVRYAVVDERGRVLAIRNQMWIANVVAAGFRHAEINGLDCRPAP